MGELEKILRLHGSRYPQMEPQDGVKLLYQSTFGGGHLLLNAQSSLERLEQEWKTLTPCLGAQPLFETLGGGMVRLGLRAAQAQGVSPVTINRLFTAGALHPTGKTAADFQQKLEGMLEFARGGVLPFSAEALADFLEGYQQAGFPAVGHSSRYRRAYHPAYRVLPGNYAACLDLCKSIDGLLAQRGKVVLAVDGPCGSGKTTLAALLTVCYDCAVIDMDDFFLPPNLRIPARFEQPGGNIHYERFLAEVVPGLAAGRAFTYRRFDCSIMDYRGETMVEPKELTVVAGSYSLHPLLEELYDLKVFTVCTPKLQAQRLLKREGETMYQRFVKEWIPMETRYFETFQVRERCDVVLDTGASLDGEG